MRRPRLCAAWARVVGAVGFAAIAAEVFGTGCEAIVTDPGFTCVGADPSSCPENYYCSASRCVPCESGGCAADGGGGPDVTREGGSDGKPPPDGAKADAPDAPAAADALGDVAGCGGALGCPCASAADCSSHICGDANALPAAFVGAAGPECTQTCCTSADCPSGLVCYGAGTGGSYCVRAARLGRGAIGAGAPGASCAGPGDCRSGNCAGGHCEDTCCSDTNCAAPTICALTGPIDGHSTFACVVHAGAAVRGACTTSPQCANGVCAVDTCRPHCCGRTSALAVGYHACELEPGAGDLYLFGSYPSADASGAAFGGACVDDTSCKTRACNTTTRTCTDVCCVDSDCAPYGAGLVCRPAQRGPAPVTTSHLICVQGP